MILHVTSTAIARRLRSGGFLWPGGNLRAGGHGPTPGKAVMQRPIFLLVSGDGLRLDALRDDLSRRYQAD